MDIQEIQRLIEECLSDPFTIETESDGNIAVLSSGSFIPEKELRQLASHFNIVSVGIDCEVPILRIVIKEPSTPISFPFCYDKPSGVLRRTKQPRFILLLADGCTENRLAKIIRHAAEYLTKAYKTEGNG